ncbi:hypothetical protein P9112_008699 [Eukaryota sp. TZLM1-RC]
MHECDYDAYFDFKNFSIQLPDLSESITLESIQLVSERMFVAKSNENTADLEQSKIESKKVIKDMDFSNLTLKQKISFNYLNFFYPILQNLDDELGQRSIQFPDNTSMNLVSHYTANQIAIEYGNNLSKQFVEYVLRWLNIITLKKFRLEQIQEIHLKKELLTKHIKVRKPLSVETLMNFLSMITLFFPFPSQI